MFSRSHMSRKWQSLDLKLCLQLQRHLLKHQAHSFHEASCATPAQHVMVVIAQEGGQDLPLRVRKMKTLGGNGRSKCDIEPGLKPK